MLRKLVAYAPVFLFASSTVNAQQCRSVQITLMKIVQASADSCEQICGNHRSAYEQAHTTATAWMFGPRDRCQTSGSEVVYRVETPGLLSSETRWTDDVEEFHDGLLANDDFKDSAFRACTLEARPENPQSATGRFTGLFRRCRSDKSLYKKNAVRHLDARAVVRSPMCFCELHIDYREMFKDEVPDTRVTECGDQAIIKRHELLDWQNYKPLQSSEELFDCTTWL